MDGGLIMYKPLADSTLLRMPKKEIIELLRTAEQNAKVSQEWVDQQAKNLKDWEPVVRCKDCKYYRCDIKDEFSSCYLGSLSGPDGNDFCCYGERKE